MDELKVVVPEVVEQEKQKLLMIGMPCYGCQMHIDATQTLIETMNNGIHFQWVSIGNESLISRARNNIMSLFYNSKDFTHLLFLDADIYMNGSDVKKLFDSGKDVVGAAVRLKSQNLIYNFNTTPKEGSNEPDSEGEIIFDEHGKDIGGRYYKVDKLGTAAIMFSRKAVEAVIDNAKKKHEKIRKSCEKLKEILKNEFPKELEAILTATDIEDILNVLDGVGYVYSRTSVLMGGSLADSMPNEYYDVCKVGVNKDIYLSEDYYLCRDLRELGFNIYVDRLIKTRHNGMMEFQ